VIGVGVGLDAFARGYATFGLLGRPPGGLPGVMVAAWATNCTWILGLGLFPLVLLLFPDGRLPTRRWRPCSSRSAAASRRSWTAASTDAATMPRPPSRPSPPAYASSST